MRQFLLLSSGLWALAISVPAYAAAPTLIPVTGYLTDSAGEPIDGTADLDFDLYATPTDDVSHFHELVEDVVVENGRFTVYLGETSLLNLSLFRDYGTLYLAMSVNGGADLEPRFTLGSSPYAGYAQYCDESASVSGIDGADLMVAGDDIAWDQIIGIPADLNDGDKDTTYTAGNGLTLTATQFSLVQSVVEGFARGVAYDTQAELITALTGEYLVSPDVECAAGDILIADGIGGWECASEVSYSGADFALSGTSCGTGEFVTGIGPTGLPLCGTDKNTTYNGSNFALSGKSCGVGSVITGIDASGNPVCAIDKDTTYTGANFALSGKSCGVGSVITGIDASGNPVCATDKDTTYTGANFALSSKSCVAGSVVTGIDATGNPVCATDKDTTYSGANFALSNQSCAAGQTVTGIDATGKPTCATPTLTPIGSIIAWTKSNARTPALPAGWVECNGQTIVDVDSVYNGTAAPALNGGNLFLRGNARSGSFGGSATHSHGVTQTGADYAPDASHFTDGTIINAANNEPPYMNVVWIIRIK